MEIVYAPAVRADPTATLACGRPQSAVSHSSSIRGTVRRVTFGRLRYELDEGIAQQACCGCGPDDPGGRVGDRRRPQDQFTVELDQGDFVRGSGDGFNHGSWYYYRGSDWWTQWFLSGPVDATQKMVVEVDLTVTVLIPPVSQLLPGGGQLDEAAVDRSDDSALAGHEESLPGEQEHRVPRDRRANGDPRNLLINSSIEITDFCPVWVSIDLRGRNVSIEGRIRYERVAKNGQILPTEDREFGDAPEGVIAYPDEGVVGMFPTCVGVGPASWIEHDSQGTLYFGAKADVEAEGNGGKCPTFAPDQYNRDETVSDGDAGLIKPRTYTIKGTPGSQTVSALTFSGLESIGNACLTASWGTTVDIEVHNTSRSVAYVNVLFDWNHDGVWEGSSPCDGVDVPEHVLVNFPVPVGYEGPLSDLGPSDFEIGPVSGYVWARFTITERAGRQELERRRRLPERRDRGLPAPRQGSAEVLHLGHRRPARDALGPVARHAVHGNRRRSALVEPGRGFPGRAERAAHRDSLLGFVQERRSAHAGLNSLAFEINIYSNKPATSSIPWSRPDQAALDPADPAIPLRRQRDHQQHQGRLARAEHPGLSRRDNHKRTFQYNICLDEEDDLFSMTLGTTYWIEIVEIPAHDTKYQFGWKTTKRSLQTGGNAVWRQCRVSAGPPMIYPEGHASSGKADGSVARRRGRGPEGRRFRRCPGPDLFHRARQRRRPAQHRVHRLPGPQRGWRSGRPAQRDRHRRRRRRDGR